MKNLKELNLGKSLNRNEMKIIMGGLPQAYDCTRGTAAPVKNVRFCSCLDICAGKCKEE